MEEISKKLKIVWICHFSNEETRNKLPLSKRRQYFDFAPWISNLIKAFEKIENVDLHVISPHRGLQQFIYQYKHKGVSYYFFKPDLPLIHRIPAFLPLDKWTSFIRNRLIVRSLIKKIKPDIINLHGAENAYYSSTVLGLKKTNIPVYIAIQGIYWNPERFKEGVKKDETRIMIERKIHGEFKYFGIGAPFLMNLIKIDNSDAIFFLKQYPLSTNLLIDNHKENKEYDFVFFARIKQSKGIEDLFDALAKVKKEKSDVRLNIIGPCASDLLDSLKQKAKKLGITNNIVFTGYLPTLKEVYQEASKARFSVLPTKIEVMPGTVLESILLGLPVITCKVGGLPFLNKDGK
ncbi:MAG: glycosyltransferase family 4 protein, partial [Nanoarchaeota archaeon]|nr:glycosyltransferase family 4 protein [Nanoarchaeota archaeon]